MTLQIIENWCRSELFDYILDAAAQQEARDALLDGGVEDTKSRRSKVIFLSDVAIKMELYNVIAEVNREHFQFDIDPICHLQYTEYDAEYLGHYDWHFDDPIIKKPQVRKLSMSMPLSDPDDYQGGNFEIEGIDVPAEKTRGKGSMLIFPSFCGHRVTPVTKGKRKSLVAWFSGPAWR